MKPRAYQETYLLAYQSASSELIAINEEFEKLRARMGHIEKLVAALKPLIFEEGEPSETPFVTTSAPEAVVAETQTQPEPEIEPAKPAADPFQQHRINHVLGIGAGIRDVRSYTRQF